MLVLKRREIESLIIKTPEGQEIIVMLSRYRDAQIDVALNRLMIM